MKINHFEGNKPEWLVHKRTLCVWQRARLWEGERELIYWCMPAALTLYLFLSFSSNISLSYLFSFFLFFLILVFYFLFFKFLYRGACVVPCTQQWPLFIVYVVTRFYYFSLQPPLSGLGVLADHHWFVCVPLPITRQRKIILLVCLPWHPSLLWCGCLLSPFPFWHVPSGSNSALLLLGGMSSQQDTSAKRAWARTSE